MRTGRTMRRRAAFGQERSEVVFEALHTLDGREVDLASAVAGDALGMGGGSGQGCSVLVR